MDLTSLFLFTEGSHNRGKIAIVGESWGAEEDRAKTPFVGESGKELTRMLQDAGISRHECFITNVCSRRPPDNDMRYFFTSTVAARKAGEQPLRGTYPDTQTRADLARLHQQLAVVRPRVIIALGNYALWALTEDNFGISDSKGWKVPTGIVNWRGSYLEWNTWDVYEESGRLALNPELHIPVIPTFHPAAILRQWSWRTPAVHDLRTRVLPLAKGFSVPNPDYRFIINPTFEQANAALDIIDALPDGSLITCDLETRAEHIACAGIAWSAHDAVCIPFMCTKGSGNYWSPGEEMVLRSRLEKTLAGDRLRLSNQNINFDRQYIFRWLFIRPKAAFDTMVAHHVCWPGTPKGLAYLSSLYCRYHRYWKDEGRKWDESMDESRLWRYNCIDAVSTWEITKELESLIKHLGFQSQFQERMDMLDIAFEMMVRGVAFDEKERMRQVMDVMQQQSQIASYLDGCIPDHLKPLLRGKTAKAEWYDSPSQLGVLFYDLFGLPEIRDKKTGNRTCDDDALEKFRLALPLLSPIIEAIQDRRSLRVIKSNFLEVQLEPYDNRLHCTFDPTGTETFRWSSYENAFWRGTNMQNIPKEQDE